MHPSSFKLHRNENTPRRRWEDQNPVLSYMLDLAKEPSTWRGMIWLALALGAPPITDTTEEKIIRAGIGLVGAIGVCFRERK